LSNKKRHKLRNLDPHFKREKERYGHPLPSRELILQILKEQGIPITEQALQILLEVTEEERYGHPLPSRELILQILKEQGIPITEQALQILLEVTVEENEIFSRRLSAMMRDGQIMRNRKGDIYVVEKLDLIKGKIQGHADGFGFLIPDDGSSDLFLSPKEMRKVLHGDSVVVREIGIDRRGRKEGALWRYWSAPYLCWLGDYTLIMASCL